MRPGGLIFLIVLLSGFGCAASGSSISVQSGVAGASSLTNVNSIICVASTGMAKECGTGSFMNVGATNPILFGKNASFATVPAISLNNTLSDSAMEGFFGDGSAFYLNSNGDIIIRPGSSGSNSFARFQASPNPGLILASTLGLWFTPNAGGAAPDTLIYRDSAGRIGFGTTTGVGNLGSWIATNGTLQATLTANAVQGGGSAPSVGTCGTIGTGSKNAAGFITSATGACTSVLTFNGFTAATGWSCAISNSTTPANVFQQTASSTTTATFTGVSASNDILRYACTAY